MFLVSLDFRGQHRSVLSTETWQYFDRTLRGCTYPETHLLCCVTHDGGLVCFVKRNMVPDCHAEIQAIEELNSFQLR
jgi:hypothetical protein